MVKKYIAYLKDNPEGYWFKRKLYGWGWTPARWQGWLVILVFLLLVVLNFYRRDSYAHSASDTLRPFLLETAALILILFFICRKTGEKPRWQWGCSQKKDDEDRHNRRPNCRS